MVLKHIRSNRKRYLGIALVILAGGWLIQNPFSGNKSKDNAELVPVSRATIEETVTAQGKLEPKTFVDVGTQVSGQLQKLYVEIGDTVEKGQLIAQIDPQLYTAKVQADQAQIKTLQAQLAEQQATVTFTKSVYERNQKLIKADAVSKEVLSSSEKEYKAAIARIDSYKAQIEQAKSQLDADRSNLGFTKIYAPIRGTVVSQSAKEGQTLNANQQAPVIMQVADLDTMTVRSQVAEADVARLRPGMDLYFTTLGSDRRWRSQLRQLLPSPDSTVTDVVLYNALVDVENKDRALMTGMSTQMFFLLGSAENALVIPARALGKKLEPAKDGKGEIYEVKVASGNSLETRPVEIGLLNRTSAQVISGLNEGDRVAITKQDAGATPGTAAPRRPQMRL